MGRPVARCQPERLVVARLRFRVASKRRQAIANPRRGLGARTVQLERSAKPQQRLLRPAVSQQRSTGRLYKDKTIRAEVRRAIIRCGGLAPRALEVLGTGASFKDLTEGKDVVWLRRIHRGCRAQGGLSLG